MLAMIANDDGVNAPGFRALHSALAEAGHEIVAVAPMRQQSAVSHCLTYFEPLRVEEIRDGSFSAIGVYGTPTDCVKLGLSEFCPREPDIVISGINEGRNVGPDIFYSGTVAAAAEAAHAGFVSLALSNANIGGDNELPKVAARAVNIAEILAKAKALPSRVINVNFPPIPFDEIRGLRVCPQAPTVWRNGYEKRLDPRGRPYWWLTGEFDRTTITKGSDMDLMAQGYVTVTPLDFEYTDMAGLEALKNLRL